MLTAEDLNAIAERITAALEKPDVARLFLPTRDRLLDEKEVALRLNIGESTVRRWVTRRILPEGRLVGSVRRWSWSEIDKWTAARGARRRSKRGQFRPRRKSEVTDGPADVDAGAGDGPRGG